MENTTIFKAENDKTQKRWVKKLRELTVELQHHHGGKKSTTSLGEWRGVFEVEEYLV